MWRYSPRQALAWLVLARARRRRERAEALSVAAMGARGEWNAVKQQIATDGG